MDLLEVPVGLLDDHPSNVFSADGGSLEELAASVAECGVLQPLVVVPGEGGRYTIVSGHRRRRAAEMAGLERVPCVVLPGGVADVLALVESNLRTRQLTVMEKARAARLLRDALGLRGSGRRKGGGKSGTGFRFKEAFGAAERQLRRYDSLNDLIPELQGCADRGVVGLKLGERLSRLSPRVQRAVWEALGDDVGRLGADDVARLREELDRGHLVLRALQGEVSRLRAELEERRRESGEARDLQRRVAALRARARDAERDLLDREAALRSLGGRVRRPSLLEAVERLARPVAAARPQIEALLEGGVDPATASNVYRWAAVLVDVGQAVRSAAAAALGWPSGGGAPGPAGPGGAAEKTEKGEST